MIISNTELLFEWETSPITWGIIPRPIVRATVRYQPLLFEWIHLNEHLKVRDGHGILLFDSVKKFVSPNLSKFYVDWIERHYQKARRQYVFI